VSEIVSTRLVMALIGVRIMVLGKPWAGSRRGPFSRELEEVRMLRMIQNIYTGEKM
jgi:hypothetical protein